MVIITIYRQELHLKKLNKTKHIHTHTASDRSYGKQRAKLQSKNSVETTKKLNQRDEERKQMK